MRILKITICLFISFFGYNSCFAQNQKSGNDTIRLGAVIIGKDTLACVFLDEVFVRAKLPRNLVRFRAKRTQLRYNVYLVYPYAIKAGMLLKDVDFYMEKLPDEKARKAYMKQLERDLNKQFRGQLENFSIHQGQILVKLINRETGQKCYNIIKNLKGGFSAFVFQGVALLFNNSLKREYDAQGDDQEIEAIVQQYLHGIPY